MHFHALFVVANGRPLENDHPEAELGILVV